MLEIQSLDVRYGAIRALHGVSINVQSGEIVALVGANGAGKSTLLKAISGFVRPNAGQILLNSRAIEGHAEARAKDGISLVPEGRQVWAELTVLEHLVLGLRTTPGARRLRAERLDEIYSLFPRLGERHKQKAGTLSGGEQQMLAIGRALISHPRVLLLDEPTLGLSPVMVHAIGEALQAARSPERALVLAEQNADFALSHSDRGYVFEVGKVRTQGAADELAARPELISAYLGADVDGAPAGEDSPKP